MRSTARLTFIATLALALGVSAAQAQHPAEHHGEPAHRPEPAHPPEPHAGPRGYERAPEPKGWNNRPPANFDRGQYQHNFRASRSFHIGPYEFRPSAKLLIDEKQKKIRLTEKETNILKYLYRAGEKPVSREELLAEVWGYNAGVTTHTLETHVYRLRQKIESDPANAKLLLTEAGGYRLAP